MLSQKNNNMSSWGALIVVLVLSVSLARLAGGAEALWIEGEDYVSSSFNRHGWYQNTNIRKDLLSPGTPGLSQGAWHTHYASNYSKTEATARYRLDIAEGGTYAWWIRLNPFRNHNGGANYGYRYRPTGGAGRPGNPSTSRKHATA